MSETISEALKKYLSDVDGIIGIYVSDKDGARIAGASIDEVPEQAFLNYVVASFIGSIQQANKIGLGDLSYMVTRYQDMTICQFNYVGNQATPPVYLTVVGTSVCDLGLITSLEPALRPMLIRLASKASSRFQAEAAMLRNSSGPYYRV
uniref:Ragulator complex protein LAMTOR3 n=3 Tax=Diphyllobothriidae TaxID=28843 RepID=A0A0V0JAJ4_SCHSO